MMKKFVYTDAMRAFIREHYLMVSSDLARAFNAEFGTDRTSRQIHGCRKAMGIKTGRTGRYEPGNVPDPKAYENRRPSSTQFKKGQTPHNALRVGDEVITSDGYLKIKIAEPDFWEFKHIFLWMSDSQTIPKGGCVIFKDGDPLNCTLENLELMTRAELLHLNRMGGVKTMPKPLQPSAVATAKLSAKYFELKKAGLEK